MKIYIATIVDRHCEPYSEAFKTIDDALSWVVAEIGDNLHYVDSEEMTESELKLAKWEWHRAYSCEGDFAYIHESELK
jgi:hypothetical protein